MDSGSFIAFLFMVLLAIIGVIIFILPYWKIFQKAGFSPLLSLLLFVPLLNLIMIYYLAFADWPSLRNRGDS